MHTHDYAQSRFVGHAPGGELHECQDCGETFVKISPRQLSRALQEKGWESEVTDDGVRVQGAAEETVTVYRDAGAWIIATPQGMNQVDDGDLDRLASAVDAASRGA